MITTNRKSLVANLRALAPLYRQRRQPEALKSVLVDCDAGGVRLRASDLETTAGLTLPGTWKGEIKPFIAVVDAKTFLNTLAVMRGEEVRFEAVISEPPGLRVYAVDDSFVELPTVCTASDFPRFPTLDATPVARLEGSALGGVLTKVAPAMGAGGSRFEIGGVNLEFREGAVHAVTTDNHRLALASAQAEILEAKEVLIPANAVRLLCGLSIAGVVELSMTQGWALIRGDGVSIATQLSDKPFPNYTSILHHSYAAHVEVDRKAMIEALKRCRKLDPVKTLCKLSIDPVAHSVSLSANSVSGTASVTLPAEVTGPTTVVGINAGQFLEQLAVVETEKLGLEIGSEYQPVHLVAGTLESFVMPIKLV